MSVVTHKATNVDVDWYRWACSARDKKDGYQAGVDSK